MERKSNIELLRIVSMMMVLVVHMDGASLGLPALDHTGISARDIWRLAVEAAVIVGVNCFTLISGYFGIRLRLKSIASFLFQCVFYAVGLASLAWLLKPEKFGFEFWLDSWMVLSHTDLWYVPAYFMLMLLSPFINAGAEALGKRHFTVFTAAFTAYNVWAGWWWHGAFNPTGYTVIQLVMVYMIGRVVRLHAVAEKAKTLRWLAGYLVCVVLVAAGYYLIGEQTFAYNSPIVLAESVALFMLFLSLDFKSKYVNYLARSAFAVYLLHKAPVVWGGLFKPFFIKCWALTDLWQFSAIVVVMAMAIYLFVVPVDACRRKISDILLRRLFCFIQNRRKKTSIL